MTQRNTRSLARRLFPTWNRREQAKWVLAKLRVDGGTWKYPVGEKFIDSAGIPEFLRSLPRYGPPIEVVDTAYDLRMKGQRIVQQVFRSRR